MPIYLTTSTLKPFLFLLFFCMSCTIAYSQMTYGITDGRKTDQCKSCELLLKEKPREVLFGIRINEAGDVFFTINNKEWFDKIIATASYGITADIVAKDRYDCNKPIAPKLYAQRGVFLKPIYRQELIRNASDDVAGGMSVKIGAVPAELRKKELEANMVILNGTQICSYTVFLNIDRTLWDLLPMGLFADTLLQNQDKSKDTTGSITYSRRVQITVPFPKGKSGYTNNELQPLYDSVRMKDYTIRQLEVRAYSSVEGPEDLNIKLMHARGDAITQALQKFQTVLPRINVITAENWLDFFRDIKGTSYSDLSALTKQEIKQRLTDKAKSAQMEPILALHRRAIVTVYLERKTGAELITDDGLAPAFKGAIDSKNVIRARLIQKEVVARINDNKLPGTYLDRLEIPVLKEFGEVLTDQLVYRYLLHTTSESRSLEELLKVRSLDPSNGHVNYNICALRFFTWKNGRDRFNSDELLADLDRLAQQGIDPSLVKRMYINYHIMKCLEYMRKADYNAKDASLDKIKDIYRQLTLSDEDLFALARYFSFYARRDWAEEILAPRMGQVNASEDIVFYYVNLCFYTPSKYSEELFRSAVLNAINLNAGRFCNFFLRGDKKGASMQLLEFEVLKRFYCENCKGQ